ncbi:MAG TPA: hypothetical protein VGQ22_13790 [Steroidobacteraceae bacterium]|jgi:hypothetical protein|nr:hypothetical protein [Steroidobacteraceae bacterium]
MSAAAILRYLAIPLRMAPVLLIGTFSVLLVVAVKAGLFGLALGLILLSWFTKYAFVLMDQLAEGVTEPPVLSIEMVNPVSEQRPMVMLLLTIGLFYSSNAAGYWIGKPGALVLMIAVAAILPAIVAVQGATGMVVQSLNPRRVFGLIWRLRGDYVLILGFIALVGLFFAVVLESSFGDALPLVLRIALLMYAWLAVFSLIGGVLFERRFDIGLDDVHTPEHLDTGDDDDDAPDERARDKEIDRIYAEWRGGAHANAWKTVLALVSQSKDEIAELRWLYQRASQWPDGRLAERLARELLPRLLAKRNTGEALDVVRERLRKNGQFRPAGSADLLALVHLSRAAGDRATARLLLQDFSKLYPGDPAQPVVDRLNTQLQ